VAEWLECRTLNQGVVGSKARRGICEQDTLNPQLRVAIKNSNVSKKKMFFLFV
jgi:hypothetical protein